MVLLRTSFTTSERIPTLGRTSAGNWPVKVKTRRMSGLYFAIAEAVVKICRDFYGRTRVDASALYFQIIDSFI